MDVNSEDIIPAMEGANEYRIIRSVAGSTLIAGAAVNLFFYILCGDDERFFGDVRAGALELAMIGAGVLLIAYEGCNTKKLQRM